MDIMDTARLNIKRHREMRGLRQQDLADKLNMNIRTYQNLEGGVTRLDIERLEQIAKVLDTSMEELLKPEGYYIHQEFKEPLNSSGFGSGYFGGENTFHHGVDKEIVDKLLEAKNGENNALKEEIQMLREDMKSLRDDNKYLKDENKYLRDKIDQLMEVVGKKG
jgi:transcriptional regulator with XRE-family HTH domain